jgi:O-antigen/teichoic acid export membrane protein
MTASIAARSDPTAADSISAPEVPGSVERGVLGGSLLVFAAESLAVPSGLAVTALLTRHFSPELYGVYALAAAGVAWLEWTVLSLLARPTFKLIAEAEDWRPVGAAVLRAHLLVGVITGAALFMASGTLARMFDVPGLALVLRVFALDIPLFMLAHAHRGIMVGRGQHASRAWTALTRWVLRVVLVAVAVVLGAPLWGVAALLAAATFGELLTARARVRPSLWTRGSEVVKVGTIFRYAAPLFVSATCLRLFDRVDIFALRLFGEPMETVGVYGVAQNLALGPGVFGLAFAPAVVAMLSFRWRRGDLEGARRGATNAFRLGMLILPFALLAAGAGGGLVRTLFGEAYSAAATPFAFLIVGATAMLVLSIGSAVLLAADHPRWTVALAVPILLAAIIGHVLAIPRFGATGAAAVSASVAVLGAVASALVARRLTGVVLPTPTLIRGVVSGSIVALTAALWPFAGLLLVAQLIVLGGLALVLMVAAGELSRSDLARIRTAARLRRGRHR